jgi:hypothetical protein
LKVKIHVEQEGRESLDIDRFLYIAMTEQRLAPHVKHVLIDAPVCSIKLTSNCTHSRLKRSIFSDSSSTGIEASYYQTQTLANSNQLQTEACRAIALGDEFQLGMVYFEGGSITRRDAPSILVLLVAKDLPDAADRLGFLKVEGDREVHEMEEHLKERRTIQLCQILRWHKLGLPIWHSLGESLHTGRLDT